MREYINLFFGYLVLGLVGWVFLPVYVTCPSYAGKFQGRGLILAIFLSKSTYTPPAATLKVARS